MFDKLKEMPSLLKMAKDMQKAMEASKISIKGKFVSIQGNLSRVLSLSINDNFDPKNKACEKEVLNIVNKFLSITEEKKQKIAMREIDSIVDENFDLSKDG